MTTECGRHRYVAKDIAVEVQESRMTDGWLAQLEPNRTVRVLRGDVELGWRRLQRGGAQTEVDVLVVEIIAEAAERASALSNPDAG